VYPFKNSLEYFKLFFLFFKVLVYFLNFGYHGGGFFSLKAWRKSLPLTILRPSDVNNEPS
jgi:hypothetical protein